MCGNKRKLKEGFGFKVRKDFESLERKIELCEIYICWMRLEIRLVLKIDVFRILLFLVIIGKLLIIGFCFLVFVFLSCFERIFCLLEL